ncbi:MAG: bifunctional 4-hydroxy-2-oxoglutarate aldolase/2-dehydro-3-deoxy-phosphogluconate aldolase [Sedimentisphaeraceae bacterium JB056]
MKKSLSTLLADGFILVYNQNKLDVVKTAEALMEAGINNMEVTCRINTPLEKIERLKKELPDFICGAASLADFPAFLDIYNAQNPSDTLPTVQQVVDAGSDYLVSAVNFSDDSYAKFGGKIPMIPGCGTATEIISQYSKGANICKMFPAKQIGGCDYIKAIDPAIHKTISIIPTGGTNMSNIADYIKAGVLVLGGSFSMIEKAKMAKIVDEQDYKLLASELKVVKEYIDKCRSEMWQGVDFSSVEEVTKATGRNFNC